MTVDPMEYLLYALDHFEIELLRTEANSCYLVGDYTIEIEGAQLFKLLQGGQVIAPFDDIEELCHFIKRDLTSYEADRT